MILRSIIACVLAVSATSSLAEPTTIEHETSIGFSDIHDVSDNFICLSYRYYFDKVNIDQQPWSISPYLQRINSVLVNYVAINDMDRIEVKGEWFS